MLDNILAERLESIGAVLLEGAKWCGKTTTCEQHCRSALYMDDPDKRNQYLRMADSEINNLLEGDTPRLIDEWQDVPKFWDAIRHRVDHREGFGQFILTGSSVLSEEKKKEISKKKAKKIMISSPKKLTSYLMLIELTRKIKRS